MHYSAIPVYFGQIPPFDDAQEADIGVQAAPCHTHYSHECLSLLVPLKNNCEYQVCDQGYPDLAHYPLLVIREKIAELVILFELFEEGFYCPPVLVDQGNSVGIVKGLVGQKTE